MHIESDLSHAELTAGLSPYSKSHTRRLKRKAGEQIAGGLDNIKAVITELEGNGDEPSTAAGDESKGRMGSKSGKIGEGKKVPLSASQRKRAL